MQTAALFVVLLALALTTSWLVSWPLLGSWRLLLRKAARPEAHAFNVLAMSMPLLVGLVLAAGAVWPAHSPGSLPGLTCHCLPGSAVVPIHLCLTHPAGALPLLPGAIFLVVWFGWRPIKRLRDVRSRLAATRQLQRSPAWSDDPQHGVRLCDLGTDNAFTVGMLRTMVLVDRRWWRSLTATERKVVTVHEGAHARCRDPLTHAVGWLLSSLLPGSLGRPLLQGWLTRAEHRADMAAAAAVGDPLVVAELLTKQARRTSIPTMVPAFSSGGVQARVHFLLNAPDAAPRLGSDLAPGLGLALFALTGLSLAGFQIHAALERLLHLF